MRKPSSVLLDIVSIDFNQCALLALAAAFEWTNLHRLDLSKNSLHQIPKGIEEALPVLQYINQNRNNFTDPKKVLDIIREIKATFNFNPFECNCSELNVDQIQTHTKTHHTTVLCMVGKNSIPIAELCYKHSNEYDRVWYISGAFWAWLFGTLAVFGVFWKCCAKL